MESFVQDPDLCTGADCDNLGKNAVNTPRVLLTDARRPPRWLRAPFDTLMPRRATSTPSVAAANHDGCRRHAGHDLGGLRRCLRRNARSADDGAGQDLHSLFRPFLGGVFADDPAPAWTRVLNGLQAQFTGAPRGIQYYYDFLVDLVDTYTDFDADCSATPRSARRISPAFPNICCSVS